MNWRKLFTYWGLYFLGVAAGFLWASNASAWTATVTFDEPNDPAYLTVVLVSEVAGDYSAGYGQRSDAGSNSVEIGNIKPDTQYYFSAYRVNPATWEKSTMSAEYPKKTGLYVEQEIIELPPLPMGNVTINITFIEEE